MGDKETEPKESFAEKAERLERESLLKRQQEMYRLLAEENRAEQSTFREMWSLISEQREGEYTIREWQTPTGKFKEITYPNGRVKSLTKVV